MPRPEPIVNGLPRLPRQTRSQQTVRRIIEATTALLSGVGVEGVTTNRIAEEAQLSVASLYQFFPNKQAVIYAAYGAWIEEVLARVSAVADSWDAAVREDRRRWRQAAEAMAAALGESVWTPRIEYELLRAMFSHRELRARDSQHMHDLALVVARLMRGAGAPLEQLVPLAAFANEQFTLAVQLTGDQANPDGTVRLARVTYLALWQGAVEGTVALVRTGVRGGHTRVVPRGGARGVNIKTPNPIENALVTNH